MLRAEVVLIILIPIIMFYSSVHSKLENYIILSKKRYTLLDEHSSIGDFILQTYFSLYITFIFTAWRLYIKKSVTQLHCDCVYIEVI